MTGEEVKSKHLKYNLQSWSRQGALNPLPIEKADGIYMWDYDGNRYTDMSSQLVNLNVGLAIRQLPMPLRSRSINIVSLHQAMQQNPVQSWQK